MATPETYQSVLPLAPVSHNTPKVHGQKTHKSSLSSSSTASFMDNMATELATSHFPKPAKGASPKLLYRIKVYQENSMDVIAIKAKHRMSRAQLLDKVLLTNNSKSSRLSYG
ncbi:hypothetical protein PCANC_05985 [Puccinia coronata f. sp. avenae]|uniref:Uncharacterized protein n=1 Tax=Puccinia coronata f. sp. avenae TaxID=200324 RepID=A0A2N5VTY1_9BASI|nr:hypothetical protein PCANC_05985 [Puccinia coronata f. sp. avenae]